MKKLLSLLTLVLLLSGYSFSAPVAYSYQIAKSFSAPGTQFGFIAGSGSAFHQITWNVIGSLLSCSVRVDSSADGITYNVGDVVAAQACTSNGQAISTSIIPNYVRINVVTLTGTGSLVTVLDGYVNNPVSSGGTVTSLTATSPVVITPSPTTNTGVISCPTCSTSTGTFPITKASVASNWLNSYDSTTGLFTATQPAESDITNLVTDLALKAPLASPALTGVPTAPTAAVATNTTQIATTAFVIANATGSGANTALSNLASVAIATPLLPASDNSIALNDATHRWTNIFSKAFNCGIGGTTGCVITGNGGTSGTATITWPAVAGTTTNPIAFSNVISVPNGSVSAPGFQVGGSQGLYSNGSRIAMSEFGGFSFGTSGTGFVENNALSIGWAASNAIGTSADTGIYRAAAGVVGVSTGGVAASAGFLQLGTTVVGSLPAAAAGNKGRIITTSDSTTVALEGQTCVGGSTNSATAISNGVVWQCF